MVTFLIPPFVSDLTPEQIQEFQTLSVLWLCCGYQVFDFKGKHPKDNIQDVSGDPRGGGQLHVGFAKFSFNCGLLEVLWLAISTITRACMGTELYNSLTSTYIALL